VLTGIAIRDVVLIERLDLAFGPGLAALTGETGAGKSILLDSFGLALGARAEAGLVRHGATQASVAASFTPPPDHPARKILAEQGFDAEDTIILKRVVPASGTARAFVNDTPCGAALLRRLGALLVELQGQHDQVGLADPATHLSLLDAFGDLAAPRDKTRAAHRAWRAAADALEQAESAIARARADEDFLRHAVADLTTLDAQEGEENQLDAARKNLQQAERRAEVLASAIAELAGGGFGAGGGRGRRDGPGTALAAAARALDRLPPPNESVAPALAAIGRAQDALAEAETLLERLVADAAPDPRGLEKAEERLFALRAAARKHQVPVANLPALRAELAARLGTLDAGEHRITSLTQALAEARAGYVAAAATLRAARITAAARLDKAVARELPPLKLERTQFFTRLLDKPESAWGEDGTEGASFLIATNPGSEPGPIARIASGGELSRLMLALKLVLARGSPVGTLVFDEVDSGIGGATAAAVGERLARLAQDVQILVVTHSPQVAARADAHMLVAKRVSNKGAATLVTTLSGEARREELARMLAGATVTDAARAAADSLLAR
jgi:DNA repair protein RecN (Recombination protein N)